MFRKRILAGAIGAILLVGFLSSCSGGSNPAINFFNKIVGRNSQGGGTPQPGSGFVSGFGGASETSLPVRVEPAVRKTISEYIMTNATLEAERQIDVLAKVSGLISQILVEEGDKVSAGDILARLDQRDVQLEVKQAEARFENDRRIFEQTSELMKRNAVSKEEYERQKYQLEVSRVQLEAAKIKLEHTEIRSPIDGIITDRYIDLGDTVGSGQKAFSVGDFDPLLAKIHIPEREIGKVKVGQSVNITAESAPGEEFEGVVSRISPIVDPGSGTIKMTVEISRSKNILKPGMFVSVRLPTETHPNALVVPKKALVLEREQEVVFVVKGGVARRTPVKLGFSDGNFVEVLGGVEEGDNIITVGQEGLRDGASVRPVGEVVAGERAPAQPEAASPSGGPRVGGSGPSGGGFDMSQLPPERRKALEDRMLGNPQVKSEYEKRLKADPELATDPQKRAEFFAEMMSKLGGGGGGR
ncbi:MAG: efflux RND transporter periplasmic adaptor subunit [bacterium]